MGGFSRFWSTDKVTTALMPTYSRLPLSFERGEGAWLWDSAGKKYLDALGGLAVCVLGHAHPGVSRAISEQAGRLIHTSNLYEIPVQQAVADSLVRLSDMSNAFFCNSGAEANEAAFKIARLYGSSLGMASPQIVVADGAFHGRTLAALSASGNPKIQAGFEPLMPGFLRVPYNDLPAIAGLAEKHSNIVAVLVEPIQGEAGIVMPSDDYLPGVRAICDQHGWLMMLDEVQTGMGRTGKWFAWQHTGSRPDVMTLAKGLANGVPIGVCLARDAAAGVFGPGAHGSTFGGNPLACSAAIAVLEAIERQGLVARAAELGDRLRDGLMATLGSNDRVTEVRGQGLMAAVEMDGPCTELVSLALERGLLINVTAERVARLLPPLIMSEAEIDEVVARLVDSVRAFHNH